MDKNWALKNAHLRKILLIQIDLPASMLRMPGISIALKD